MKNLKENFARVDKLIAEGKQEEFTETEFFLSLHETETDRE